MVRQERDALGAGLALPPLLGEGQIQADHQGFHGVAERGRLLVEATGSRLHTLVSREGTATTSRVLPAKSLRPLGVEIGIQGLEVRSLVSGFHFGPDQGEGIAQEGHGGGAFLHADSPRLVGRSRARAGICSRHATAAILSQGRSEKFSAPWRKIINAGRPPARRGTDDAGAGPIPPTARMLE